MRAGVIDIGSNSIKLIIGEKGDEQIKILDSLKNVLPIGKSAFLKGRISQDIINQVIHVLEKYKQKLKEYDISNVRVIATTAVREAKNQDIFLDTIYRKTGFNIEVLNVGDVVYYIDSFLSLKLKKTYPIHEKNLLIAELGAGSLDVSIMEKGLTLFNFGIPIGTLRLKQFKDKIEGSHEETSEVVTEYIENSIFYLKEILPRLQIDDIILIDETYTSYVQNILSNKKLESNFFKFNQKESDDFIGKVVSLNPEEASSQFNLPKDIAETVSGFAIIISTLLKLNKSNYIYILETSLPEAILTNILFDFEMAKANNKAVHLLSVASFICKKYNVDLAHAKHVADLSETLFTSLRNVLGLTEDSLLYLLLSAYMHDVGMFISNRSHHKHSEYIINSLNFFRLTDEEIKIIASTARYHRRTSPLKTHFVYSSLSQENQILVQKLSAILKIANALDSSHKQKVKKLDVKVGKNEEVSLTVYTTDNFILERMNFLEKKEPFEEITGNKISLIVKSP